MAALSAPRCGSGDSPALLVTVTLLYPNPIMLLVLLFGGFETWRRWKALARSLEAQRLPLR